MKKEKIFTAEDVERLLNELFEDVFKEVNGISTISIQSLSSVTNQDARLVSVKGPNMEIFKPVGGAFLGKETNKTYVNLPNGEYLHLDEFISALKLYFSKEENKRRVFFVESDEWNNKKRKVDISKLDELKKITKSSSRIVLDKINSIHTQDARVVTANVPGDSLTYDKRIGGAFLGSPSGNLRKGYPAQMLPLDQSPFIYKEDIINALEKIFKAYRNTLKAIIPAAIPIIGTVTSGEAETKVEQIDSQEVEVPVYSEITEYIYSDGLVIGDVIYKTKGELFTNDSWGNPDKGNIGNEYTQKSEYTVNGFNVINTETGEYYTCFEKGQSLEQFIINLKSEGKLGENYTVSYHVNEGNSFTQVGSSNDIGWFKYDENNYNIFSRYPIGTKTKKVQTGVEIEKIEKTEYVTYEYEIDNINDEVSVVIMTDKDGNMLTLTSKDGASFKLDQDITLVDLNGKEYKCTVEKTDKKLRLKAIVPFVIPIIKKKEEEEESKDKDSEEKEGSKQR